MTPSVIRMIVEEAKAAAQTASANYLTNTLRGKDAFPCGYAWLNVYQLNGENIRANSKVGKSLALCGITKDTYSGSFRWSNPSDIYVQNVDCKYEGAQAAKEVFAKYGFKAIVGSRWD
jgi:hypothetical protein